MTKQKKQDKSPEGNEKTDAKTGKGKKWKHISAKTEAGALKAMLKKKKSTCSR